MLSSSDSNGTTAPRDVYNPPDINDLTKDARFWYEHGIQNASINLHPEFESIAVILGQGTPFPAGGKPALINHLQTLLTQVEDTNINLKVVVSQLTALVESLQIWSRDHISFLNKMKIKSILWYVDGIRDNKTYYLLNGAALWCKERVKMLTQVDNLEQEIRKEFIHYEEMILELRDEINDSAQIHVEAVLKLVEEAKKVESNGDEIRRIVGDMKIDWDEKKQVILKNGDDLVAVIKARMDQ